jgi:hypothetical protein
MTSGGRADGWSLSQFVKQQTLSIVIARLDRAIQHSKDACA